MLNIVECQLSSLVKIMGCHFNHEKFFFNQIFLKD